LFFGEANCVSCHKGPALNSMEFYALGMNDLPEEGTYGDGVDETTKLGRGGFTNDPLDNYKFKVPQLYNLKDSRFYGHGGSFTRLRDVVSYKNSGRAQNPEVPAQQLAIEFGPLGLLESEIDAITEFLSEALYDPNLSRYVPSQTLSGLCFPNNDSQSQQDLGCQ
ncbi:MAG: cytochrome-c peroxidase, partial [Bacteroidota bacterium]